MDNIQTCLQHAEWHCGEQGVRFTSKRKQILFSLLQSEKAMSAYELVDIAKMNSGSPCLPYLPATGIH